MLLSNHKVRRIFPALLFYEHFNYIIFIHLNGNTNQIKQEADGQSVFWNFFPNTCDLLPFYKRCRSEASFSLILMGGGYGLVITKQNFLYIWCKKYWLLTDVWFHGSISLPGDLHNCYCKVHNDSHRITRVVACNLMFHCFKSLDLRQWQIRKCNNVF